MRTRSACNAILLALTASTTVAISACAPDTTAPLVTQETARLVTDRKVQDLRDRYDWIGKYHTDGLAFVYSRLKENSGKPRKKDQLCKVAAKATKEFHRAARKGEVPAGFVDPALFSETCGTEGSTAPIGMNAQVPNPRGTANQLSPLAASYLDQIANAINSATSRPALLNSLRSIEYSAVVNLPSDQAGLIVGTVSIAISSIDYWEANLDAWTSLPGAIATPYNRLAGAVGITPPSTPRTIGSPRWWTHPAVRTYLRIVGIDAIGGGRVLYTTWAIGPIGWDAAAAMALWSSVSMCLSLLF